MIEGTNRKEKEGSIGNEIERTRGWREFTLITLWYSSFSLQNISKKTMVKVKSREHPKLD